MLKQFIAVIFCFFFITAAITNVTAQTTYKYAERDTTSLHMDIYDPVGESNHCCIVFVFGGGFIGGTRDHKSNVSYAKMLIDKGYTVACIDYRLGLKGKKLNKVNIIHELDLAIEMAAEDLLDATLFLIQNAAKFDIDTSKIVLCGSSAGAITVLQADYELSNRSEMAKNIPEGFRYGGVMAFSGAIYSHNGLVKYKNAPAPTLLLHGIDDKLVPYKFIRLGNLGFFGSNSLAKRFKKYGYPYYIRRYETLGHEVAMIMNHEIELCDQFIHQFVFEKKQKQIDATIFDSEIKQERRWHDLKSRDLRKAAKSSR